MSVNAREETFEQIELFGKPALLTYSRINPNTVPEGVYCYDLRGSYFDPCRPIMVEKSVAVNHAGSVLTTEPIKFRESTDDCCGIGDGLHFVGKSIDLAEFYAKHGLTLPPDNRKFILRPASPDETVFFYPSKENDAQLGTVGELYIDFGRRGIGFYLGWLAHNSARFDTAEFKAELDEFVNEMKRVGPVQNRFEMESYPDSLRGKISGMSYGVMAESEKYCYYVGCFLNRKGYQAHIYIYDKRQQELCLQEKQPDEGITMGGI